MAEKREANLLLVYASGFQPVLVQNKYLNETDSQLFFYLHLWLLIDGEATALHVLTVHSLNELVLYLKL